MWAPLRKLLSKSRSLNNTLGEVVFETPPLRGHFSHSYLQWRVKKSLNGYYYFISLKVRPDAYEGPEGAVRNYFNLSLSTAEQAKSSLEACIAELHRLSNENKGAAAWKG